jgi:hypothetical protein
MVHHPTSPPERDTHSVARLTRRTMRHLSRLSLGARADLLRVLTSSSRVRADIIRQFHERPDGLGMAEVLMDLEADELLRIQAIDLLRQSLEDPGGP